MREPSGGLVELLRRAPPRDDSRELRQQLRREASGESRPLLVASSSKALDLDEDALWAAAAPICSEPSARLLPEAAPKEPGDRAAHRRVLERFLRAAHRIAAAESSPSLCHGRCCLGGLLAVALLRALALAEGVEPGGVLFGIHWLSSTSDLICLFAASPFFAQGTVGKCVQLGCIGPMMTLIFSMCLADVGALLAFLAIAAPRPVAGGRSWITVLRASVGAWDFALLSSVALQTALCSSCWRIYRELRAAGLYPPGAKPLGLGPIEEVSCLELVCEADDARRTSAACRSGTCMGDHEPVTAVVVTIRTSDELEGDRSLMPL